MRARTKIFLSGLCIICYIVLAPINIIAQEGKSEREIWVQYLDKVARPVMYNLANDILKENIQVEKSEMSKNLKYRKESTCLEAFSRTLCGISPWLNGSGGTVEEISLRIQYREWAIKAIANAVNPNSCDFMNWKNQQSLVETSFLALAFIRCPWLWENSSDDVKKNIIAIFNGSKSIIPFQNNWLLFTAMIESFFCYQDMPYDVNRIDYGIRKFMQHWYVGDGYFSDGTNFSMDYYNSYVIQPYMANILDILEQKNNDFDWARPELSTINERYAEIQEQTINPDGSFPAYGRSIVYRGGAFHHLSDMALRHKLPASLHPAQVRCALTAVIKRTLDAPETFSTEGWLNMGLCGHQPNLADSYISTGSLYLCSLIFLPLGLSPDDPFWRKPHEPWSAAKIWN